MGGGGVLLVGRAIADMAVQDDEGRAVLGLAEDRQRILDALEVIGIADPEHVPAIAHEAGGDILGEGEPRIAFDGDVVVVVDPAEVIQLQMPGQRRRLRAHAFHQAAVAADGIDVVVEDREVRLVVAGAQPFPRDRHADAGGDALAQRTGGRLHAGHQMIFRMARRLAVELAEILDVVEGDRGLAELLVFGIHRLGLGQIEGRPEQHRGMAVGEHEAVAIGPDRILGIEGHDPVPERIDQGSQRHGRAGMARLGLLDGIDGERADRVDRELIELLVGHADSLSAAFSGKARRLPVAVSSWASRDGRRTRSAWPRAACRRNPPGRGS